MSQIFDYMSTHPEVVRTVMDNEANYQKALLKCSKFAERFGADEYYLTDSPFTDVGLRSVVLSKKPRRAGKWNEDKLNPGAYLPAPTNPLFVDMVLLEYSHQSVPGLPRNLTGKAWVVGKVAYVTARAGELGPQWEITDINREALAG